MTPTKPHADGMLAALKTAHTCGVACTAAVTLGDGSMRRLHCPLTTLDMSHEVDRRIVQSLYVADVKEALR